LRATVPPAPPPREEANVRDLRLGIQNDTRPRPMLLRRVSAKEVSRGYVRLGRGIQELVNYINK
jgi:hypothetical protein